MKKCQILVTVLMMVALLSTAAMAGNLVASTPVSIVINPGLLTLTPISGTLTFQPVNIGTVMAGSGFPYTTPSVNVPSFTLQDATGSGLGWHVNFNITKLAGPNSHNLDVYYNQTAAQLTGTGGQAVDATGGPLKQNVTKQTINTDTSVVKANTGYGMGTYTYQTLNSDFEVPIGRSQIFAGTYNGTFTATILQGPGGTGSLSMTIQ